MKRKSPLNTALKARNLATHQVKVATDNLRKANQELGKAFRIERKWAGYSLRAMAKKLEISAPYLSDIELGRRNLPEFWNLKVHF